MDTTLFYDFRQEVVDYAAYRLGRALEAKYFYVSAQDYDPARYAGALVFTDKRIVPALRFRVYLQLSATIGIIPGSFRLYEDPDYPPSPDDELYVLDATVTQELLTQWLFIQQELDAFSQNNYILVDPITALIMHEGDYIAYA